MVVTEHADAALEKAVLSAISTDQDLSEISIQVSRQVVILIGHVDSLAELNRAEILACGVEGAVSVDSSLIAITDGQPDITRDNAILYEAEQALTRHRVLRENQVLVDVHNGKATLTGMVETLKQKLEAHRIISEIRGITTILNLIETAAAENAAGDPEDAG